MDSIPQEHLFTMKYYPSDFFYATNNLDYPKGYEACEILNEEVEKSDCLKIPKDKSISSGKIYKCYQQELCLNKKLVDQLYNIRNNHFTSEEKYNNIDAKYFYEKIKSVNLVIGIILGIVFIRYNIQSS